jgi:ribosome-binding factor A
LEEEYHRLKHALSTRIRKHIRRIPEFEMFLDETLDEMYRIDALFERINNDKQS